MAGIKKLTYQDKQDILKAVKYDGVSVQELAEKYKITTSYIYQVMRAETSGNEHRLVKENKKLTTRLNQAYQLIGEMSTELKKTTDKS